MKYLIFIFKRRFRQKTLNNFLSIKKIKNVRVLNFSGPILYFLGKLLYFFFKSKKIIFISCDGLDYLYRESNSINLWMGGTTNKIPNEYKKYKNSLKIWEENKDQILNDLSLVDNIEFWKKIIDINDENGQRFYIDIKSLIRSELVQVLISTLKDRFILVGTNWKKQYPNALENNYSNKFIENLYRGNICIDFGSKNSEKCIYPRSCKIIESGGLLFQCINKDSAEIFKNLLNKTCFVSLQDMKEKISFFLNNSDQLESLLISQQKNFESEDLNYKMIKKVENIIYNI